MPEAPILGHGNSGLEIGPGENTEGKKRMDIYIVLLDYGYDGREIEGVFSTESKAAEFVSERDNTQLSGSLVTVKWKVDNPKENYNGLTLAEIC